MFAKVPQSSHPESLGFPSYPGAHELLCGGFKYALFSPLPGEMIQFD